MQALVEDLIQVLVREMALYDQVLLLQEEERVALTSRRPTEVLELARRKETALLKIRTLEESRRLICVRLAKHWTLPPASITLTEIRKRCEADLDKRLAETHSQMCDYMDKLRAANDANRRLCNQGIEMVHSIMQSVAADVSESSRQGYAAKTASSCANGGGASTRHWTI